MTEGLRRRLARDPGAGRSAPPSARRWRRVGLALALAAGAIVLAAGEPPAADETGSVWHGVYSEAQAERGAQAYAAHCLACHGVQLQGIGEARPLSGPLFLSNWNGLTLGDLFERMRTTMPFDKPRSLGRETYADVLAYILKANGFPAGPDELPARAEMLQQVRIDAFRSASAGLSASEAQTQARPPRLTGARPARGTPPPEPAQPYVAETGFLKPPPGRVIGSTSGVAVDSAGHVWVADRCGANDCAGSALDPIMEFDARGTFVKAFGRGLFLFPHGLFIDARDHIWVTDGHADGKIGAQVLEFDRRGKLLRRLGRAGVSKAGKDSFSQPNAVLVTRDGTIFVADGHDPELGVARIVRFDAEGRYVGEFGSPGVAAGHMDVPHSLAMDSKGRLFVADRWNNRVDVFGQDGTLIAMWPQFGRPSGVFVDAHDRLYVTDSESRKPEGYGHHPGWRRGIHVGDAETGRVDVFIPDTYPEPDKVATSGAEGIWVGPDGVIWGAQVGQRAVVRYVRRP